MGCAASAFANRSSPTPWNFCWVTLSPGVSSQPGSPLHRMRLAANALATFLVRVHEPDILRTSCRHPNSRSSGAHSAEIRLGLRLLGQSKAISSSSAASRGEYYLSGDKGIIVTVCRRRESGARIGRDPTAALTPGHSTPTKSMRRQGCS
jgi:hypothetical protein